MVDGMDALKDASLVLPYVQPLRLFLFFFFFCVCRWLLLGLK